MSFHPAVEQWFRRVVRRADAATGAGLAADCARRVDAGVRAHRQRQDAGGLSVVPRPRDVLRRCRRKTRGAACSTSRRSRRWRWTSSATCARRLPASRAWPPRAATPRRADREHPHRRHAGARPREVPARARRHPDHDARVAVPAAHLARAARPAQRRDGDRRRDPRAGAHQARRASGACRSSGSSRSPAGRCSASACRRRSGRSTKSRGSWGECSVEADDDSDARSRRHDGDEAARRREAEASRAPRLAPRVSRLASAEARADSTTSSPRLVRLRPGVR